MNYKHLFNIIWNTNINKIGYAVKIFWNNGFYYKYDFIEMKGGLKL